VPATPFNEVSLIRLREGALWAVSAWPPGRKPNVRFHFATRAPHMTHMRRGPKILADEYLVNLEWRLCRGIPLLSGGCPASATLADRQVQEADENTHLLLSQSV
jgi:hypothetical protein